MNTEQKLEYIVDRLLVKTQDNSCEWKCGADKKFTLRTNSGILYLYWNHIIGGTDTIVLDIVSYNDKEAILASLSKDKSEENTNLVRLFNAVTVYHQNYVDSYIDKLMTDLQKLGTF